MEGSFKNPYLMMGTRQPTKRVVEEPAIITKAEPKKATIDFVEDSIPASRSQSRSRSRKSSNRSHRRSNSRSQSNEVRGKYMNQDYQTIKDKLSKQNKQIVQKFQKYTHDGVRDDSPE